MKKTICAVLMAAMAVSAAPVWAANGEGAKATPAKPLATAIEKSGTDLATPALGVSQSATAAQKVPTSLPRNGSSRIRKQGGGGKTGMIIGLVSTAVGLGATVYMVKEMNKDKDDQ